MSNKAKLLKNLSQGDKVETLEILETEIVDNAVYTNPETGTRQPSEISVLVKIEYKCKNYYIDFQTTTTNDYGAFSSSLSPYDGTDSYDELQDACGCDFDSIIDKIYDESNCQKIWSEYVDKNYTRNLGHYGGMDANSEINEMTAK